MVKIRAKAIPVTKKKYHCLTRILEQAELIRSDRTKIELSPEWKGKVICLDEVGLDNEATIENFSIENAPKNEPYFLEVRGSLLVAEFRNQYSALSYYYPVVGNARGYEFDSYTEPNDQNCCFKVTDYGEHPDPDSTTDPNEYDYMNNFREGAYYVKDAGHLETWRW